MSITISDQRNEHIIDMQREMLQPLLQPQSPPPQRQPQPPCLWDCCIYKVPEALRSLNPDAYTPQLISVGPIHYGKKELKSMEDKKKSYSDSFWDQRTRNEEHRKEYISYLEEEEQNIRRCYSEEFIHLLYKDQFLQIILLDSVFIMELLLRFEENREVQQSKDFILSNAWRSNFIQRDLFLLENQLPICVLKKLYKLVRIPNRKFLEIAACYFESYYPQPQDPSLKSKLMMYNESVHFTDLVRCLYIPQNMDDDSSDSSRPPVLKSAIKLKKAGITFEAPSKTCLLKLDFKKGKLSKFLLCFSCIPFLNSVKARLKIPSYQIDERTEWILRNLIAFEQFQYPKHTYICNYIAFFDYLIQSKEDVDLLVESQVIVHQLGSDEEVATLVNGLCKNIMILKPCYRNNIIESVNKHYSCRWNLAMGELRWVYYRDLWRGSSTIVGLAVLFFTFYNFFSSVFD